MSTGLIIKFTVEKRNLDFFDNGLDDIKKELKSKYYYDFDLYEQSEVDDFYVFELKSKVMEENLVPLLKEIYPKLYTDKESYVNCEYVLQDLLNSNKEEIMDLAKNGYKIPFQYDKYANPDYVYGKFGKEVVVRYAMISLYADGKIMLETYPAQFNFFKFCMVKAYPKNPIVASLKVYISG